MPAYTMSTAWVGIANVLDRDPEGSGVVVPVLSDREVEPVAPIRDAGQGVGAVPANVYRYHGLVRRSSQGGHPIEPLPVLYRQLVALADYAVFEDGCIVMLVRRRATNRVPSVASSPILNLAMAAWSSPAMPANSSAWDTISWT